MISNPPYKKYNTGRLNPDIQKAIARHEIAMDIQTLAAKADTLLGHGGRFMIIFPFERLQDIERAIQTTSIRPEWIRYVHTSRQKTTQACYLFRAQGYKRNQTYFIPYFRVAG